MKKTIIFTTLMLLSTLSNAAIWRGPINTKVFQNNNCEQTDSCDLKKIKMTTQEYKVTLADGQESYGTKMYFQYETKKKSDLKKYVVVQKLKGCQFSTYKMNGKIFHDASVSNNSFGESIPFVFPNWVIDSVDKDPVYNSLADDNLPRHYAYRWNHKKGSFNSKTEEYLLDKEPKYTELYVRDMPGTAFYSKIQEGFESTKNISLKFEICLYKENDVPYETNRDDLLENITPIKCFDWSSSYIYDFESKKFNSPKEIHPFCFK